jgi:hypothetical protein
MANRIDEEGAEIYDPSNFDSQVREYAKLKASMAFMETRQKELRDNIFDYLANNGEEELDGSINLYLDHEIEGVTRLHKQSRVVRKLDEEVAERIIVEMGIEDDVYETKRVINEDYLMGAMYSGKITEEQLDEMFPKTITYALRTLKK